MAAGRNARPSPRRPAHPTSTHRCSSTATTGRKRPEPADRPAGPRSTRTACAAAPNPDACGPETAQPSSESTTDATSPRPTRVPRPTCASPPRTSRSRTLRARARNRPPPRPATDDSGVRLGRIRSARRRSPRVENPGQHPQRNVIGQPLITARLHPSHTWHGLENNRAPF